MTYDIWSFVIYGLVALVGALATAIGILGRIVLSNLETRMDGQDKRLDDLEDTLTQFRIEEAKNSSRCGHD